MVAEPKMLPKGDQTMSDTENREMECVDPEVDMPEPYELPDLPALLTRPLGLEGWTHLEPVILAALASEDPMLLVGAHGTAKSFLLERLAQALGLEYRFYNASLINFDDLVGIPMPDEEKRSLRYISTPTAVWDAEVVFFDEISRTRPELQNKLFPIVHEKRVQGIELERLRYRWSAMNPPPAEDTLDERPDLYLGAEPLDPALADRFAFIIQVPAWGNLTRTERLRILNDQFGGQHCFTVPLADLVAGALQCLSELQQCPPPLLPEYILTLVDHLAEGKLELSTRRVTMLHRDILAVHAARVSLYAAAFPDLPPGAVDWGTSALLALQNALPQTAQGRSVDSTLVLAAHRQAWEVSRLDADNPWRTLLTISDALERCLRAFEFGDAVDADALSKLVLDALASLPEGATRTAAALAIYGANNRGRRLHATVYETIAQDIREILRPHRASPAGGGCPRHRYRSAMKMADRLRKEKDPTKQRFSRYAANLLNAMVPDGLDQATPSEIVKVFTGVWERLEAARAA